MKDLIIFIDSCDTLIDESTQVFDERGIVTEAQWIPGAQEALDELYNEGYQIVLVADGEWESFVNVYTKNGRWNCFCEKVVSEIVGVQKPEQLMFETAFHLLQLKNEEKENIVMIGNNLKKDIAGANEFGII